MKFLAKFPESIILQHGWVYKGQSANDLRIKSALLSEQKGFCAYTETKLQKTDKPHLEHFDPSLKYNDDYYNYYAVIPWPNFTKIGKHYTGSRFFQVPDQLYRRIRYRNERFEAIDIQDQEATELIEFLGFNEPELYEDRRDHILRLRELFEKHCEGSTQALMDYLQRHPAELSFPTAIEAAFGIDLTDIIQSLTA